MSTKEHSYWILANPDVEIEHELRDRRYRELPDIAAFGMHTGKNAKKVIDKAALKYFGDLRTQLSRIRDLRSLLTLLATTGYWTNLRNTNSSEYEMAIEQRTCGDLRRTSKFAVETFLFDLFSSGTHLTANPSSSEEDIYRAVVSCELSFDNFYLSNQTHHMFSNSTTLELVKDEAHYWRHSIGEQEQATFKSFDNQRREYLKTICPTFSALSSFDLDKIAIDGVTFSQQFDTIFADRFSLDDIEAVVQALIDASNRKLIYIDSQPTILKHLVDETSIEPARLENVLSLFVLSSSALTSLSNSIPDADLAAMIHLTDESRLSRLSFQPIISIEIENKPTLITSPPLLREAHLLFKRNLIFGEFLEKMFGTDLLTPVSELQTWCKRDWFETSVRRHISEHLPHRFVVHKDRDLFGISVKEAGDLDIVLFDKTDNSIIVADCKLITPRTENKGFKSDINLFASGRVYPRKLYKKLQLVDKNRAAFVKGARDRYGLSLPMNFKVSGLFITGYPSIASLYSPEFPVVPIKFLIQYFNTGKF